MPGEFQTATVQEVNCGKLLQAIDFFSQILHLEQLSFYGYDMIHDMLGLDQSCLFIREDKNYILKYQKNYGTESWIIPETEHHKRVATLFGRIMTAEQKDYFSQLDLDAFSAKIVIPLIIKDQMVGFIFANGRKDGPFTEEMLVFAGALMQLMNRSYENAMNFLELEKKNYELDKKIFNLFFINHCSRTLLAELNLDKIYGICIDIIRELTASSVTAFGLYDETRDKVLIKGYQDILTFQSYYGEFQLKKGAQVPSKVVYHLERDKAELACFFSDVEALQALRAEYIVMLVKDHILGFVSIGAPVSDRVYDQTLFDLIETIATSIYISVVNAQFFEKNRQQNETIQKKFEMLEKMNRMTRNINSCETQEELCAIAMQSLEIGYGVQQAFLCLYQDGKLQVMGDINLPQFKGNIISPGAGLNDLDSKGVYYEFSTRDIQLFFPEFSPERHKEANCLVIAPIRIDRLALDDRGTLGYLVVLETESALKEEEVLLIDTLSNSIAPIVFQMNETRRIQTHYTENQEALLLADIQEKLDSRNKYFIDFKVWYKRIPRIPFEKPDVSEFSAYPVYLVGETLFSPMEEDVDPEGYDDELMIMDLEDFIQQAKQI